MKSSSLPNRRHSNSCTILSEPISFTSTFLSVILWQRNQHQQQQQGWSGRNKNNILMIIVITTLLRIVLITGIVNISIIPNDIINHWNYSSNVRSILMNPIYTIQHLQEADAIRHLSSVALSSSSSLKTRKFALAYQDCVSKQQQRQQQQQQAVTYLPQKSIIIKDQCHIHIPPLVLFGMEMIMLMIHESYIWMAFIILLIDISIMIQFIRLAYHVFQYEFVTTNHEIYIQETYMDNKLRPVSTSIIYQYIMSFTTIHQDIDVTNVTQSSSHNITNNIHDDHTICQNGTKKNTTTNCCEYTQNKLYNFHQTDLPIWIGLLYYSNPITILSSGCFYNDQCVYNHHHHNHIVNNIDVQNDISTCCYQNISILLLLTALVESCRYHYCCCYDTTVSPQQQQSSSSNRSLSSSNSIMYGSLILSLATYMECHYCIFIIPIVLWNRGNDRMLYIFYFVTFTYMLHYLSGCLLGVDTMSYYTIIQSTHLYSFRLYNMTPSLSTIWYLSMELFIRFRNYFELLLGGTPYFLLLPITIRLYRYPTILVAIFWMLGVLFRPPGTLYQFNIGLCLLLMNPRSVIRMIPLTSIIALCAIPIPVTLYTVAHWMWLEPMNGEANYLYFQCLAYNIFVAVILLGFCSASLRRDKAYRMTLKQMQTKSDTKRAGIFEPNNISLEKKTD